MNAKKIFLIFVLLISFSIISSLVIAVVPTPNYFWAFNDAGPNVWSDSIRNASCTKVGTVTSTSTAKIGSKAVYINGGYLNCTNLKMPALTENVLYAFWASNSTGATNFFGLRNKTVYLLAPYMQMQASSDTIYGVSAERTVSFPLKASENNYQFYYMSRNGSSDIDRHLLAGINRSSSKRDSEYDIDELKIGFSSFTSQFTIGARPISSTPDRRYIGNIDAFGIWYNLTLTDAVLDEIFNSGTGYEVTTTTSSTTTTTTSTTTSSTTSTTVIVPDPGDPETPSEPNIVERIFGNIALIIGLIVFLVMVILVAVISDGNPYAVLIAILGGAVVIGAIFIISESLITILIIAGILIGVIGITSAIGGKK